MSIKKLQKSFSYALRGLALVLRHEQNFRIQLVFGFGALVAAFFFRISLNQFLILLCMICLILILECINTAMERVSDIVKPRLSEQVKIVKDIMAGAVLLASAFSLLIGICIFLPYLMELRVERFLIP